MIILLSEPITYRLNHPWQRFISFLKIQRQGRKATNCGYSVLYTDGLDKCLAVLTYIKTLQLPPVDLVRPLALALGYFIQNQRY